MAKGKSVNPADAFRKAQRKKELKKNKTDRAKARDFALVKKDTRELEEDVQKLEAASERSAADKTRLAELKSELEKINKKKEDYVAEHPEHRKLVFKSRRPQNASEETAEAVPIPKSRNIFNKHGLPRHPERSIYYDSVLNPYGVPPPGMPYLERPLRPDEVASDQEGDADDDDDVIMPEGPPPGADEEEDSDDDIPMPDGPPPPQDGPSQGSSTPPPLPPTPMSLAFGAAPPPPPGFPPLPLMPVPPPPPPTGFSNIMPPPPSGFPVPPLFPSSSYPPPPPGVPHMSHPLPMPTHPTVQAPFSPPFPPIAPGIPHPPPGFPQMPPPPPGFFPRRAQSSASVQDPLSSIPHQTYQQHRSTRNGPPSQATLPLTGQSQPLSGGVALSNAGRSPAPPGAATVEAAPQLRDFKKEATAFVPTALKRKKATTGPSSKINAAPTLGQTIGSEDIEVPAAIRPDLMSTLKQNLGSAVSVPAAKSVSAAVKIVGFQQKDDYAKFLEEMGDVLGPKT